ncbi:hypothetical protein MHYP_G00113860 [Metynnis hypsauchen]
MQLAWTTECANECEMFTRMIFRGTSLAPHDPSSFQAAMPSEQFDRQQRCSPYPSNFCTSEASRDLRNLSIPILRLHG